MNKLKWLQTTSCLTVVLMLVLCKSVYTCHANDVFTSSDFAAWVKDQPRYFQQIAKTAKPLALAFEEIEHGLDHPGKREHLTMVGYALL